MSAAEAKSFDILVAMRLVVTVRIRMRVAYASASSSFPADVDVAGFLMKTSFRNACRMAYDICFPAHAG